MKKKKVVWYKQETTAAQKTSLRPKHKANYGTNPAIA
jgi:hypothetical protein